MNHVAERSRAAWRQIEFEWGRTQERWDDSASDYFEKTWWQPLEDEVGRYLRALDELLELLADAREAARD